MFWCFNTKQSDEGGAGRKGSHSWVLLFNPISANCILMRFSVTRLGSGFIISARFTGRWDRCDANEGPGLNRSLRLSAWYTVFSGSGAARHPSLGRQCDWKSMQPKPLPLRVHAHWLTVREEEEGEEERGALRDREATERKDWNGKTPRVLLGLRQTRVRFHL